MTKQASKQKLSFEQALATLEEIVSAIEDGDVSLEQSIEKYAEGVTLIKQCRTILDAAEKKIQILSKDMGGQLAPAGELPENDDADADPAS